MRKLLSIFMAICISTVCIITVSADTVYVNNFFRYTVGIGSVTIVGYYGQDAEVTVPSVIAGNPVNTIAAGAFSGCANVTKITLPDTIMTIEQGAFAPWQSVVHKNIQSECDDESSESQTVSTPSVDSSAIIDDSQGSETSEIEQTSATQSKQTEFTSVADVQQQTSGIDEQEAAFDIEDESEYNSLQSVSEGDSEEKIPNYFLSIVTGVMCLLIISGVIYVFVRKKKK